MCVCVEQQQPPPAHCQLDSPMKGLFCMGGCGRWSDGLRDRGQRGSQPPASSLFQTGPEAIRVLGGLSCHSPPAVTSVCTSPSQRPRPKHLPLSRFRALLQSCCLYSTAHPNSYPRPQANLFFFFPANTVSHSPLWARCTGQIQLAQWQPSKPCIAGIMCMLTDGMQGGAGVCVFSCVYQSLRILGGGMLYTLDSHQRKTKISSCMTVTFIPESLRWMRGKWARRVCAVCGCPCLLRLSKCLQVVQALLLTHLDPPSFLPFSNPFSLCLTSLSPSLWSFLYSRSRLHLKHEPILSRLIK